MKLDEINYEQVQKEIEEFISTLECKNKYSYEYEYYNYLDRLGLLKIMVDKINLNEIDLIVDKWKPEEAVRYLYKMIKELKGVS